MTDALFRMSTDGIYTTPIEDEAPIAVIDVTSKTKREVSLQQTCPRKNACDVEDNENLPEKTGTAPTLKGVLRQQRTDSFCQQADAQDSNTKATNVEERTRRPKVINLSRRSEASSNSI